MLASFRTICTFAASSASTMICPSLSVPLTIYTPSAKIMTVLPSMLTPEAAEVSALLPFRVMVSASLSSYSSERSRSVNISDLLTALSADCSDEVVVTAELLAPEAVPQDVSVSANASISARIEIRAFVMKPFCTPASLYVLFL